MRTKVFLFMLIILLIPRVILSQESENKEITTYKKNQIGIQFNPFINEQFFNFRYMNTISAVRYSHRITKNFTSGVELSFNLPINISSIQNFQIYNYFMYNIGLITRYSVLSERQIQVFAEASPFYSHYWRELTSSSDPTSYTDYKFGYYVAPGVTLFSKNKRVSFDLYYKFSNLYFINGNKSVLSYKVNYNF